MLYHGSINQLWEKNSSSSLFCSVFIHWQYFWPIHPSVRPSIHPSIMEMSQTCSHLYETGTGNNLHTGLVLLMTHGGILLTNEVMNWFWMCPRASFLYAPGLREMCLFAPVLWRSSLWLEVFYGCMCVCAGLGPIPELSAWNIAALSLDCCVRSFGPIHKNAIRCRSLPGLMKLTAIHQSGRFKPQWRAGGCFKGSASNYHMQNSSKCLAVKMGLANQRFHNYFTTFLLLVKFLPLLSDLACWMECFWNLFFFFFFTNPSIKTLSENLEGDELFVFHQNPSWQGVLATRHEGTAITMLWLDSCF